MLALSIPYSLPVISEDEAESVKQVLLSGKIAYGDIVKQFEANLSHYFSTGQAIVVSSGTAALHLVYTLLKAKIKKKKMLVGLPCNTFLSTATMALHLDSRLELLEINRFMQLDLDLLEEKLKHGFCPDIIVPVSYAGLSWDQERLWNLSKTYNFFILADHAHAPGGSYILKDGKMVTTANVSFADIAVLSFQATKTITTGEGGAVLLNDSTLADRCRSLRNHGIVKEASMKPYWYEGREPGFNYRLTDFQAALGIKQLENLKLRTESRAAIATFYNKAFEKAKISYLKEPDFARSSHHLYVIFSENRDALLAKLRENGFFVQVHYLPLYKHPVIQQEVKVKEVAFPMTENLFNQAISIPLWPGIPTEVCETVVKIIKEYSLS